MRIKDIKVIPIYPKLAERYQHRQVDLYGIDHRTIFRVEADNGLVGYGDQRVRPDGQPTQSNVDPLVGQNPFDYINQNLASGLSGALYDLMGKYLEIPAYKLMGQKVRDQIPVAAWTRPASPEHFRGEILRAVDEGYTIFKMHTCTYHDVIEQTRLAEEVAPEGFQIHYDLNSNRSLASALPLIKQMERDHPIIGYIEDPLVKNDIDGWHRLRNQVNLPIIMHGTPLGGIQELLQGIADIYMLESGVGNTLTTGFAFGKGNIQTLIQLTGGTLTKAFALHMAAVLPTHTAHTINLDDQYAENEDVAPLIPVISGSSAVPKGPGLGIDVNEDALARLAANQPIEPPKHVGVLHMPNGHTFYGRSYISPTDLTGREEGTIRGIKSELWLDDDTQEFDHVYQRVQKEGTFRAN